MSRSTLIAFATAALLAAPHLANATVFTASASFYDNTTNNTLQVNATPNPASFTTPALTIGQSYYDAGFITLSTSGDFASLFGNTQSDQIGLNFTFSSPSAANAPVGQGGTVTQTEFLFARFDNATVTWQGDTNFDKSGNSYAKQIVNFTDGAQIELDVYDALISGTTTARAGQVDINIKDLKDPVPEPASMLLLGTGLAGLGLIRRRRAASV